MSNTILEVKDLTVAFDGRTVVDNVSYTLRRGETLGIVGESGSGKSVSSMALMGLLPKNATVSGNAWIANNVDGRSGNAGSEVSDRTDLISLDENGFREIRGQRISMIFQEPMTSLNPVHKCGAQVVEMLQLHQKVGDEEARRRVLQLFEEVLLPRPEKIFDSYPHEISGGQKQRVMIAMALVCKPDIIIADEPTTALDVTVQKTILELLRDLQRKHNVAVIFITHDLGVIAQVADEIAVMYQGRIVEQGRAETILHNPQHPYTKGLLACRPPLDSRPRRLPTISDFMNGSIFSDAVASGEEPILNNKVKPTQETPLLSVCDLSVEFALEKNIFGKARKKLRAVDGISFDVYRGETIGLVGESGCGKTTLGRALLRLVDMSSGSVMYDGCRLDKMSRSEVRRMRSRIQIVFQDPYSSLNPRLTVGQAIMEPLRHVSVAERRKEAEEMMERVGLKREWFDRYPHEFSGGQRQRVCIARALILRPELVICDESVSALDVSVQAQVLNLLNELKEHFNYTYIFISHDLSVVHFISNRILVMRQGRLVEMDDADTLFANPKDEYTKKLLDAIPRIEI